MSLLDRLKAVGEYDSTGRFTLDEEKARQKLARFQLTDPHRFVLELVMAAVRLGARHIEVLTAPELSVTWTGAAFRPEALRDLDHFLLEGPGAERHLAIALNAVQQLKPRKVSVTPGGVQIAGLEHRRELAELVAHECGYGTAEVWLNGRRVVPEAEYHGHPLTVGRVTAGLHPSLVASELRLVHYGVVVGRPPTAFSLPLRAVVESDCFTLNASHSDVVQDEVLEEALKQVEEVGRRCLSLVVEGYEPEARLAAFLRTQVRKDLGWDLPLFPLVSGNLASARALEAQALRLGLVPVCAAAPPGTPPDLLLVRPGVEADLKRLFGARVGPGQEHVLNRLQADANRRAWEGRPWEPVLKLGRWLSRAPVEGPHFRGEVGLEAQDGPRSAVLTVIFQGRLLGVESLEAPLPYVAALDFSELDVRSDWSGPAPGRLYREALDKLAQTAERLYLELSEQDIDGSLGGVREGLLVMLSSAKGGRLKHFWRARLFLLATGGSISLAALEEAHARGERLYMLPQGVALPREALPEGVILAWHPQGEAILSRALGKRLRTFSARQVASLQELAVRLQQRKEPRLAGGGQVHRFALGELRLMPALGQGEVEVLRGGVSLGTVTVPSAGCSFVAIVECPRLTPQPDYRGAVADSVWQEVLASVAAAEEAALGELTAHPPTDSAWDPVLLHLLPRYLTERLSSRALFAAHPVAVSLRQVREEFERWGHVLVAAPGEISKVVHDRPILLSRAGLDALVPGLVWEECGARLLRQDSERRFLARKAVAAVRIGGALREGLAPPLTGEVALSPGGEVVLYHLNRSIGCATWLPSPLQGAVQHPAFRPRADYSGVETDAAWEDARTGVLAAASRLVGQAAAAGAKLSLAAWLELAAWEGLTPDDKARVWSVPFLPRAGGGKLSLAEVGGEAWYLTGLSGVAPARPVLLLKPDEVGLVGGLIKLSSYQAQHYRDGLLAARHARLAKLPTRLGPTFVTAVFEEAGLHGELGIPRKLRREVVLVQEGGPVAWYEPALPLVGLLSGSWDLERLPMRTELGKEQRRRLTHFAHDLYDELASSFDPRLHREVMLEYLRTEWRTAQDSAVARLPLFHCWKGTASLAALLEEVEERGELVCLERGVTPPATEARLYPLLDAELLPAIFAGKLRVLRRPRWGEQVGAALRAAGAAAGSGLWNAARGLVVPGWQQVERLAGKMTGLLEGVASAAVAAPAVAAAPAEKESPERRLLAAVRRHFSLTVQNPARKYSRGIIERMCWKRHILGPPSWWDSHGTLCLNLSDASMRYALAHQDDDPAVVQILLVHVFCVINRRLEEVTDAHEEEFLRGLGTSLALAYEAEEEAAEG